MHEDDLPWLHALGSKRYPARFDPDAACQWFRNIVLKSPMMFYPVRSADAFAISMLSCLPWTPNELETNVVFLCADDGAMWQALKLLRASIAWAERRKCTVWRMSSDTDYDLRALAYRLGARDLSPRFELRLGG